jgi:hypothetical protein
MSKYTVHRPRHFSEIQRVDEQGRVLDLPAAAGAHEAPKLLLIVNRIQRVWPLPFPFLMRRAYEPSAAGTAKVKTVQSRW